MARYCSAGCKGAMLPCMRPSYDPILLPARDGIGFIPPLCDGHEGRAGDECTGKRLQPALAHYGPGKDEEGACCPTHADRQPVPCTVFVRDEPPCDGHSDEAEESGHAGKHAALHEGTSR